METAKERRRFSMAQQLGKAFSASQAEVLSAVIAEAYDDLVAASDFSELKSSVERLAEAQIRTEARVSELAEAQKRTEAKVCEQAEAQKRTEAKVCELAEAQKRTEAKVCELAEAQKRTEVKVCELAEAQKKTEKTVRKLVKDVSELQKTVGGLSNDIGYSLEDRMFPAMKGFLLHRYGVEAQVLERTYIVYPSGKHDEVNIYVEGTKDGKKVYLAGECKSQPGKKHLERFDKMLQRLGAHLGEEVKGFLVGYLFSPDLEDLLKSRYPHIDYFKTYEVEREGKRER